MERFKKYDNGWKLLTIFAKNSILDVSQGFEFASDIGLLGIAYLQF